MTDGQDTGDCRLTGAPRAVIDTRKLVDYALDLAHERGGDKARVFASARGFDRSNHELLVDQLRQGVTTHRAVPRRADRFGLRFSVDIEVRGPRGSAVVRTAWIYDPGSLIPA